MTRKQRDDLEEAFIYFIAIYAWLQYSNYIKGIIAGEKERALDGNIALVTAVFANIALQMQGVIPKTKIIDTYIPGAEKEFAKFVMKHPPEVKTTPVKVETPNIMYEARVLRRANKTEEEITKTLEKRYASKVRSIRALRTEGHEILEKRKNEEAASVGMKKKIWRTQRDDDVRDTAWHDNVADQEVNIYDDFKAAGMKANHPGDIRLPPGERINCRCYLEYVK
ncbi:MAG: phage minor head protein [Paludibacter sp.]|nr:phage minor head protein [Paludibacter sp.]